MALADQPARLTTAAAPPAHQPLVVGGAAALIAATALWVNGTLEAQPAITFLMGVLLGFTLYRASFGFTGAWRSVLVRGRGTSARKTLLMLGCAAVVTIGVHALWGYPVTVHPVGWALLFGAFMFGIGMQLGGCCGSGTAYVAGSGSARGMVTLGFFIAGSVWGSVDAPFYWSWPRFGRLALIEEIGPVAAAAVTLALLGALWALTLWRERAMHGAVERVAPGAGPLWQRAVFGPWSPWFGGALLGVLAGLVVVVTQQPWGITFGYTLYGVKTLAALGFDVSSWTGALAPSPFWGADWAQAAIAEPLWRNNAANTTIGLMMGAALASGLVGKWRPSLRGIPALSLLGAAVGGLLMGYGARISTGCNIGAMVNGIASGSLHGWAWMAAAVLGTVLGTRLRPLFRIAD